MVVWAQNRSEQNDGDKKFLFLPENEARTAQDVAESLQRETLLHELN